MQPVVPKVPAPYNKLYGRIIAFSRNQVLWRFGAASGSKYARTLKFHTSHFLFTRCLYDGRILEAEFNSSANYLNNPQSENILFLFDVDPSNNAHSRWEVEQIKKELAAQITLILNHQTKLVTGKLITLLNYNVWRKDVPLSGLKLLWQKPID